MSAARFATETLGGVIEAVRQRRRQRREQRRNGQR